MMRPIYFRFSRCFFIIIFTFFTFGLYSQTQLKQVIRGTITDAVTGQALIGASVLLPGTEPIKGTTTDSSGRYRLEAVSVGRYNVQATYLGYEMIQVPEVLVESGKEVILHLSLSEQVEKLNEVLVRTSRQAATLSPLSLRSINIEEVTRFPATFNDPARLVMTYAGVVNTNDQANHISVRGNSPNSTSWHLEGAEIVNPNHLSDGGTFSSRPSQSGGGVNILSAQLLGNSNFYSSAFPARYGNALGGIMDMQFRNGNEEQHEFTVQAGLVGFDFSAEGPLSKDKGISYLINYRYSFVGLLTAMGVDFGGEAISFQDLAFNVKAPVGKNGVLKMFGMGGVSENIFTGQRDSAFWEIDKDRFDIDYTNQMGALGATYSNKMGNRASMKTTIVVSGITTKKRSDLIAEDGSETKDWSFDLINNRKTTLRSSLSYKINKKHALNLGVSAVEHLFDIDTRNYLDRSFGKNGGWLLGTYAQWIWRPINPLKIQLGVQQSHFTFTKDNVVEPRASIRWEASAKDRVSIAYGLHSQIQAGQMYFSSRFIESEEPNRYLDFSKSHHTVLAYNRKLGAQSELTVEAYYQALFNIPVYNYLNDDVVNYSAINLLGDYQFWRLQNEGTGQNYGIELTWQRFLHDDYFFLANGSVYESKFTGIDGIEHDTRFNGNYLFNLTGGKEFHWKKKETQKTLGVNARLTYAGGLRRTPISEQDSANEFLVTVKDYSKPFNIKQKDYFKVDFRIYLKNNKSKYNTTFALDIQNLTNAQNEAYHYYDHTQGRSLIEYQLGLIPNLSYKIEF